MNRATARARWEALRDGARRLWGELTDDDFLRAEGAKDRLRATVRGRPGGTKESTRERLERLTR